MRYFLLMIVLISCKTIPQGSFEVEQKRDFPDYSELKYWAAHPQKKDNADRTPGSIYEDMQSEAEADVFFLHPTTYTKEKGNTEWNGNLDDEELNEKTDETAILFQASVFNGAAKIYAPRYRQAHIFSYYTRSDGYDQSSAEQAFELAYSDVRKAFEYYLQHWNEGRPIIIASHSQGTTHAKKLVKEYFEGEPLMSQLVAAYLIGIPVSKSEFSELEPCQNSTETGCYVSWRSYQRGYLPQWKDGAEDIVVTNPLSWTTDTLYVPASENDGTVLYDFNKGVKKGIVDAQRHKGHLWVTKPKFRGSIFLRTRNYHIADYNFFYANMRENAKERVQAFLQRENQ
ncbi:DUF3089 domain-containing protein [Portibacter marinus]|uniref:DUF3089 domain-containing protein n=1 Tax=Portibacter marinus TaxID=2898660 RepID=UPI001F333D4E|nr:DUF3089 domain-containing protein [Portibacter marinus]